MLALRILHHEQYHAPMLMIELTLCPTLKRSTPSEFCLLVTRFHQRRHVPALAVAQIGSSIEAALAALFQLLICVDFGQL